MKTIFFILPAAFAISSKTPTNTSCPSITRSEAECFIDKFASVFAREGDWRSTAGDILCDDFEYISNSLLSVQGASLNNGTTTGVVYSSATAWLDHLEKWSFVNVTTRDFIVGDCGKIVWSVDFGRVGPAPVPVRAMGIVTTRFGPLGGGELVAARYEAEFDSIAAGKGLGLDCSGCVRREEPLPVGYGSL